MERARKEEIVEDLRGVFGAAGMVVVTHNNGLTVGEATELRRSMRDAGATFRVTKNRLALHALRDTPCEGLKDLFTAHRGGRLGRSRSAAKATVDYARRNAKLVVIGGAMAGRCSTPRA